MICPNCSTRLADTATRCLVCGQDLKTVPLPQRHTFSRTVLFLILDGSVDSFEIHRVMEPTISVEGNLNCLGISMPAGSGTLELSFKEEGVIVIHVPNNVPIARR